MTHGCVKGMSLKKSLFLTRLRADQRFRRQHRLHHETAGAGVHHADRAQRQQCHGLNGVAQPPGVVHIVRRQRPDQRFMQRAEQRGSRDRRVLRWQMTGADRGVDACGDLAGDFAAARQPRRGDVDIDRLGQDAPGELAL